MSEEKTESVEVPAALQAAIERAVAAAVGATQTQNERNTEYVPFIQENLLPAVADHLVQLLAHPEKLETSLGEFTGTEETRRNGAKVTIYDAPFQTRLVVSHEREGQDGQQLEPRAMLEVKLSNSIFGGWVRAFSFRPSKSIQGVTAMYQGGERKRG